jgi:hypothetical protein
MKYGFNKFLLCALMYTISFIGCTKTGKLTDLKLYITKSEVRLAIGDPLDVRGTIKNKYNEAIEVWEYKLYKHEDADQLEFYWLYFCDDTLVQWGEAGDWEKEADRVYDIRFKTGKYKS